jgi:hypothetical protein
MWAIRPNRGKEILMPNHILPPVFDAGQPNEALHPAQFRHSGPWGDNSALKRASDVAGTTFEKLAAAHEFRVTPGDDPFTHSGKLTHIVDEIGRGFASQWQDAKDNLKRERSRVESDLTAKAGLKVNPDYRSAIVGVFSGLKESERMAAIDAAIEAGEGAVLATLLEAPSLVTGLDAEQKATIKARAFAKADPNTHALLQELDKATAKAERASLAAIDAQMKLREGTDKFAKQTARSKQLENQIRSGLAA